MPASTGLAPHPGPACSPGSKTRFRPAPVREHARHLLLKAVRAVCPG